MPAVRAKLTDIKHRIDDRTEPLVRHDVVGAASAIAFHTFFSLVPLLALMGWITHELAISGTPILQPLLRVAPRAVGALADGQFMQLGEGAESVLPPLSIAMFLWLASGGASTAMSVFERIFGAKRRPWLQRRIMALGFVIGALVVLAASAAVVVVAVWFGSVVAGAVASIAPLTAVWLLVASFFRIANAREAGTKARIFGGAALTVSLWVAVSAGFSLYVRTLASYSRFYGGLATVVVVLLWLWLLAIALLAGGALNAHNERRARR
jgi:membrane protein